MKTTQRKLIKQSALSILTIVGIGTMLWGNAGCAQETAQPKEAIKTNISTSHIVDNTDSVNRVPYISLYYVTPKVDKGKKATINYYVTDFDQSEYMKDDHSKTFTIDYWVDGAKKTIPNVKIGDNSLTLDPMQPGEKLFALQATDTEGRKSYRIFQQFLVVDPADAVIPQDKILTPDLKKFGIYNDDTHPVETTAGLSKMLKWASDNGYRKVLLPKGTYRIDENNTVEMATRLTLDMNGSTFKLNPNALSKVLMFDMVHCFDSHVVNGTFEGDLKEHDYKNAPNNSEWVNAISFSQEARYCSFKNVKVVSITGYGAATDSYGKGAGSRSAARPTKIGAFKLGDVNAKGEVVASKARQTTTEMTDISPFQKEYGFIQLGRYLGYQGSPTYDWDYKASFYDADKKYIGDIEGYQYRRLYLPKNAKYARFTVFNPSVSEDRLKSFSLFNFRNPYNCAFIDVHFQDVRCVGMAPKSFNNLLVEGNTFKNCGWALAKCAFDAEDGWDMMQDMTFRNNTFIDNPNADFLTVGGDNFVMENNVMSVNMGDRTKGSVYRNNTITDALLKFGKRYRTGYLRISGNTIKGSVTLDSMVSDPDREYRISDNILDGIVTATNRDGMQPNAYYYKCKIEGGIRLNGKIVDCEIKNVTNSGQTFEIYDSTISDSSLGSSLGLSTIAGSTIKNTHLRTMRGQMLLKDNTIIDSEGTSSNDWSPVHEWTLIGNKVNTSLKYLVQIGNNYKKVVLKDNTITSTNPGFVAVSLFNLKKNSQKQTVTLVDNIFNAAGGLALNMIRITDETGPITLYLYGNKYNRISEINQSAVNAPNVTIVRKEPAERDE